MPKLMIEELRNLDGRPLDAIVSDLLVAALRTRAAQPPLQWISKDMGAAKVDLEDKDAIRDMDDLWFRNPREGR